MKRLEPKKLYRIPGVVAMGEELIHATSIASLQRER